MQVDQQAFELLARLSKTPILLLNSTGKVIQHAQLQGLPLISEDGFFAADNLETLKQHLSICARSLNLVTLSIMINQKRFRVEGARFNPREQDPLVIFYISKNKNIESNFDKLNQMTELSYEIKQHLALEKKLLQQAEELKQSRDKIKELAHFDSVTKLPNRFYFQETLDATIKRAHRMQHGFVVLFLDIDNFKHINDTYGHSIGDEVLTEVASRIKKVIREIDHVSRWGGDEFTVILDLLDTYNDAEKFAARLNATIAEPYNIKGIELFLTCSIGISLYPDAGTSRADLLRHSDAAMYECKSAGKDSYEFYTNKITQKNTRYLSIENNLRHAIQHDELYLVYQPQYEIASNKIKGAEALLRWQSASLGNVPPNDFIPIAEKSGLIDSIGDWVINRALLEFSKWDKRYPNLSLSININCSILQLENRKFCQRIKELVNFYGVDGTRVIFEATETTLMERIAEVCDQLSELNNLGIRVAIDDFGKGYSSLTYLKKLPLSSLKVDKSFVDDLPNDPSDMAIVKAIIQLAKAMNLEVIAEGVESQEQLSCLTALGCQSAQGFHLSKPLSNKDLIKLLNQFSHQQD